MANQKEPFVFISYAHSDSNTVLPVLKRLKEGGIKLWYDNGIEAGSEWPEYIANKIVECDRVIFFITESYLKSQNCIRELNFAIKNRKEILTVFLKNIKLSPGVDMQLGSYQAVFYQRYPNVDSFTKSLCKERFFDRCRFKAENKSNVNNPGKPKQENTDAQQSGTESSKTAKTAEKKPESNSKFGKIMWLATLLALFCTFIHTIKGLPLSNPNYKYAFIIAMVMLAICTIVNLILICSSTASKFKKFKWIALSFFVKFLINCILCSLVTNITVMYGFLALLSVVLGNAVVEAVMFVILCVVFF